jgi:hypothetical protein
LLCPASASHLSNLCVRMSESAESNCPQTPNRNTCASQIFKTTTIIDKIKASTSPWGSGLEYVLRIPLCVVRGDWMGRGGPSDETGKTEIPCHSRCGTIKIPPCSKALSAEHRPKFCSPSPAIVAADLQLCIKFLGQTDRKLKKSFDLRRSFQRARLGPHNVNYCTTSS